LRGILASYATIWHRANRDEELNERLKIWISKEKDSAKLSWWAENPNYWLHPDAPEQMALRIRKELMTAEVAAREFKAPAASSLIQSALSRAAVEMSEMADILEFDELGYLLNGLIREPLIETPSLHLTAHNLVSARSANRSEAFRQKLVNAFLTHPSFGDPRLQVANWDFPALATARAAILGWLSVEDIRTFFEIILTPGSDKHGRKDFWLRYERKIRMSRVFISTADSRRRREQLEDLTTRGRRFGSINDTTSVFVLDLGRVVAVEFSQVGNATYLYTKENFNKIMSDMFVSQTNLSIVKNSSLSIQPPSASKYSPRERNRRLGGFRHIDGWQSTVDRELEKYGIEADD
jgi:hypothetical protein